MENTPQTAKGVFAFVSVCTSYCNLVKEGKSSERDVADFGSGHQSALSENVPPPQSPWERAAVKDTAEIALR